MLDDQIGSGKSQSMYKILGADQKEYGPVTAEELRIWIAQGRAAALDSGGSACSS